MEDLKKIVWLASYPKSGNTWFRVFITNLLKEDNQPADINNLLGGPIASSREQFDEITGLASSDLTRQEIENLRPDVYIHEARKSKEMLFKKVHDAYIYTASGKPLIPVEITKAVVYFIRNPLDIITSFANHLHASPDDTIRYMATQKYAFCNKDYKLHNQLEQKLLTWSNHVKSWVDESGLPVLVVRYEDMIDHSFDIFKKIIRFLDMETTDEKIDKAIQFSTFGILKQQEQKSGFKEKAPDSPSFFRKGKAGSWKEELNKKQVNSIIQSHKEVMERYGYLPL